MGGGEVGAGALMEGEVDVVAVEEEVRCLVSVHRVSVNAVRANACIGMSYWMKICKM
jgi:hypothetical protein